MMTQTILLVEDEENDVFFLQQAMQRAGLRNTLQVARHGREALEYLQGAGKFSNRQDFPLPSLVLLDLKLPYVMGLDVLKWIREQPEVSMTIVIVFTSSQEESDIRNAYRCGANAYLVKPSDVGQLESVVQAIRDFWLAHNRPPPTAEAE